MILRLKDQRKIRFLDIFSQTYISSSDNYFVVSPVRQVLRNSTLLFLYRRVRQIVSIIKIINMIRRYCKDLKMT